MINALKNFFRESFLRRKSSTEAGHITEPEEKILELKARAEEAEAERSRLRTILNSMPDGVIALDSSLKIMLVNPRLCCLFGIDYDKDILGINPQGMSLLELSRSIELEEAAQQVLSSGQPFEQTLRLFASGTVGNSFPGNKLPENKPPGNMFSRHFRVFAAPLETGSLEGRGVVIVLSDISRLVKLEQVRKDFAANISHELRTPIQVVKGFAENVLCSSLDNKDEIRHFVEIIQKNAQTMENLTHDLLTLVSLEDEGASRPSMEVTLLAPLIAEAADMVEIAARKKAISIKTSCPPDLGAKLYGPFIIQALVNLLDNGIKYSSPGSRVKVDAFREGDQLVIEVKDKGIGIPAEHMGRIFERFYRVDRSRSREAISKAGGKADSKADGKTDGKADGTGLGLAIVRHIALLHNGSAEVESHAGEGSVFRLRLPCF